MPAKKGAAYVEVGKEGTIEAMMAGKKGKREAADKPAAKESAKKARKEKAPKKEVTAAAAEAVQLGQAPAADVEMKEEQGIVGSGRVAAQNLSLKEKVKVKLSDKQDRIAVKEEQKCESEKDALEATAAGSPDETQRRLGEFSVVNEAGQPEPVDAMDFSDKELYISGVVYPKDGPTSKETGRRVQRFGPLKGFSLDLSTKAARVVLETDSASYTCIRPAASYKKLHTHLSDQADICCEVFHALNTASGGSPQATLEEVVARLARSQLARGYPSAREALMVNGRFLLAQLAKQRGHKGFCYSDTDFCRALQREVKDFKYVGSQKQNTGIIIRDGKAQQEQAAAADGADAQLAADEEFARQMQAKEDAKARNRGPKGGAPKGGKGAAYIKVSEAEIADDYPAPTPYNKEEEETDELLLFDEELMDVDPEFLPRRLLTDFTIYNAEGLNASLELLPMWSGVDSDVELYASGVVVEDDGEWAGGQSLEAPPVAAEEAAAGSSAEAAGAGGSSSAAGGSSSAAAPAAAQEPAGMRMYLSQIREWIVECSCDQLFISIRTDVAWYRLSQPAAKYAPWFAVVLKVARLAVKVLGMLSAEARASRLSFNDIVKHLAQQDEAQSTFVSKKLPVVERFVVVHGQIILNQFQNYPKEAVRRSAFATGLKEHMQMVRHSKLYKEVAKPVHMRKAVNRNPMKDRAAGKKSKPMTATATTMVKAIWQSYFNVPGQKKDGEGDGQTADLAVEAPAAKEVEEDENEEEPEDDNQEDALAHPTSPTAGRQQQKKTVAKKKKKPALPKGAWVGGVDKTVDGDKFYKKAKVGEVELSLGAVVLLQQEDDSSSDSENPAEGEEPAEAPLGLVQAMWQTPDGEKQVQVRLMARGGETVLGDAASVDELFLTTKLETRVLSGVTGTVVAKQLCRDVDPAKRLQYAKEDAELRERNEAAAKEGGPLEYFWRRQYVPEKGMYCDLPRDLQLGTRLPEGDGKPKKGVRALEGGKGFVKDGVEYREGDCLYVGPAVFDQLEDAQQERELPEYLANSRFHKGSYEGLRAWGIGQLVRLGATSSKKDKEAGKAGAGKDSGKVTSLTLKRFYRPEDVSKELAYKSSSYHEVYASEELVTVSVEEVVGKCRIVPEGYPTAGNTFVCTKTFTRKGKKFSAAPKLEAPEDLEPVPAADAKAASKDKGKGKAAAMEVDGGESQDPLLNDGIALATMDIFAGCGGLSEGMHQAGAAYTKWAVEYEHPAAEAFKLNNPDAAVFCNNCNVLLHAAMAKAGLGDDCMASQEAEEESAALPVDQLAALPLPGEVDFICGGPPCQGYSGMNRFNKGNWSMVQNSMVMAFLSYCDFYRPRYFLLENVRNFVSHNKSFTFRLTVRSLLDMGYQVRFGVLNAGNFGVAQSRKRTFIWAAAPGELLPDWPQLMHCFRTPQLTINLPGGVQYTAVPQTVGAPLRPVTVRDTIGDLPAIENGHNLDEMDYPGAPVSAFQRTIRGSCQKLTEHICKTMNELNLERCRCIPKNAPGADWRVLEEIVKADPSREKYNGQPLVPWCLPNTADRHNGWRGLFGRLDFEGHFPTSTTDPQPMGKVGQVFHPEQDRIVSVRECARAQGFPDKHRFYGNVHNKHRQVGNAVPPPLAAALGRQLRKALEEQAERDAQERLAAQL